jgi:hypothetical protein
VIGGLLERAHARTAQQVGETRDAVGLEHAYRRHVERMREGFVGAHRAAVLAVEVLGLEALVVCRHVG